MKVIYIVGPYRDDRGEYYISENIRKAKDHALDVWAMGGVALCPHTNTAFFGGARGIKDDVWLAGDLELLKRCDAVWAIWGWRDSPGSVSEVEYARENGIPVFYSSQEVEEFIGG